jgi:hypothetical protein
MHILTTWESIGNPNPILVIATRPRPLMETYCNNPPDYLSHQATKEQVINGFRGPTKWASIYIHGPWPMSCWVGPEVRLGHH